MQREPLQWNDNCSGGAWFLISSYQLIELIEQGRSYATAGRYGKVLARDLKSRGVQSNGRAVLKDLTRTGSRPNARYIKS